MQSNKRLGWQAMWKEKKYSVEHALSLYAHSFLYLPAKAIYDEKYLDTQAQLIGQCHIYLIGYVPIIDLRDITQVDRNAVFTFRLMQTSLKVTLPIPDGFNLTKKQRKWFFVNDKNQMIMPSTEQLQMHLHSETGKILFDIQYIGQSYGVEGARHAINLLKKHETLQKIALQNAPIGQSLQLLLLEVVPANRTITLFNPHSDEDEAAEARIEQGLDKLFETTELERISLYEAALIRYFNPKFNKIFRDSFPSTNLKILKECYKKDFSAIAAEISFDYLPFSLCSHEVKPASYHIANFNLHKAANRDVFFGEAPP